MKKVVTFGELLMCLSTPGAQRLKQASNLEVDFGGAEANVAVSLAQFGDNVSFVSRVPANDLGERALMAVRQFNVNTENVRWGGKRLGLYFFENGAVYRPSQVIYDREYSSISEIKKGEFDWETIFQDADWFHWTGITPALSEQAAEVTLEALIAARKLGLKVSGDYNYRSSLWNWGKSAAEVMPELLQYCDIMSGVHPDVDVLKAGVKEEDFRQAGDEMLSKYPNCKLVVFTTRGSHSASHNTWSGSIYDGNKVFSSKTYDLTHIVDRVGGGDSFMAALIYALRHYDDLQQVVDFAAGASALKHFVPGDGNICSIEEVESLLQNVNGLIKR